MEQNLSFFDWLKTTVPGYKIDAENERQILAVSAWVKRDPEFSKMGEFFSLKKALFFAGNIGTGKTDLMTQLNRYLRSYLHSSASFQMYVAWQFAGEYSKDGHKVFSGHERGNKCYDELCLIDDRNPVPTREYANHFGNKILVGEELIMFRYNAFKVHGAHTHFTSNAYPAQMQQIYGPRAYDRLMEMCNFIVFTGKSRRWSNEPAIYHDSNKQQEVVSRPLSEEEHQQNKAAFDRSYHDYLSGVDISDRMGIMYYGLKSYGCDVDQSYEQYYQEGRRNYAVPVGRIMSASTIESEKDNAGVKHANRMCVEKYFERMKAAGAKSIFGMVDVDIDSLLNIQK